MTTYNTYQEAKIANPESEVVTAGSDWNGDPALAGKFQSLVKPNEEKSNGFHIVDGTHSWVICNPADHCMTIEKFLANGHELVDGDVVMSKSEEVVVVTSKMMAIAMSTKSRSDCDNFVLRAAALEEKKPRTKVEYVEVTDSIFDLRPDFEAGELFSKVNHARDYSAINNTQTLAQALHQSCCYRRIETPITEREAFIDEVAKCLMNANDPINPGSALFDSGKFKLVN